MAVEDEPGLDGAAVSPPNRRVRPVRVTTCSLASRLKGARQPEGRISAAVDGLP
jgi:hypothetical protein